MYSMKETCEKTSLSYETLKFYCNEGLVPNVSRNKNNHRIFSEQDVAWLNNLTCLRDCGMTLSEMKIYLELALEGETSIDPRKEMLEEKRHKLIKQLDNIKSNIEYIDQKQKFYDDVKSGKIDYYSNVIKEGKVN